MSGSLGVEETLQPLVESAVSLQQVTKVFGAGQSLVIALEGIDLEVPTGRFTCLVGASGCGKSTLLSLVAGLEKPSAGSVTVAGRTALMFQEAALFGWLTLQKNVELAIKLRGGSTRQERKSEAMELLELVRLADFAHHRPHEVSGGMRQRAALARSLAQKPDVLLMDEPFGALDAITRDLLHEELESIWRTQAMTVLFVTHNVREAVRLGDEVIVLSSRPGRVVERIAVDVERPRRIESAAVASVAATISDRLREEVRRHGDH
ncbi:MAG: ABC transporter ATP-binding protein [Actinomycetota bacterium]